MNALVNAHTTVEISRVLEVLPEKEDLLANVTAATGVDFQSDTEGRMHMLGYWHQVLDGHNQLVQALQLHNIGDIEGVDTGLPDIDLDELVEAHIGEEGPPPLEGEETANGGQVARDMIADLDKKIEQKKSGKTDASQLVEPSADQLKFSDEVGASALPGSADTPDMRMLGLGLYSAMTDSGDASDELVEMHSFDMDGLKVVISSGSIVSCGGDSIVNDCDRGMLHKSGLASEISQAAGVTYRMECNRYVLKNGRLKVGDVLSTGAHRLNYRMVLNAVGPSWDMFENKEECEFSLATTYYNAFRLANASGSQTLNLPLLCLDQEVPVEISSRAFYHAVKRFAADSLKPRSLQKINLVEGDDGMLTTSVEVIKFMISEKVSGPGSWGNEAVATEIGKEGETKSSIDTKKSKAKSPGSTEKPTASANGK